MLERTRFREALPRDASDQAEVFYHAIMEGAANHYTLAQREAWASALWRPIFKESDPDTLETTRIWAARRGLGVGAVAAHFQGV